MKDMCNVDRAQPSACVAPCLYNVRDKGCMRQVRPSRKRGTDGNSIRVRHQMHSRRDMAE